MSKEVIMPKIGLDMEEGTIEKWLKAVGDPVKEGEPLVDIETDKAGGDYQGDCLGGDR